MIRRLRRLHRFRFSDVVVCPGAGEVGSIRGSIICVNLRPSAVRLYAFRVHSRLLFVFIRGIETLNDSDESLFHGGI
jgi:hypothetical protein